MLFLLVWFSRERERRGHDGPLGDLYAMLAIVCLLMLTLVPPLHAVMRGDEDRSAVTGDPDYAAGVAAFERADWPGVIDYMGKVVARRPWRDDAYTFMGYAYRKLGNYGEAFASYHKALALNPHHRGALEYLGEAYLEMDCVQRAAEILARLEATCKRITVGTSQSDWKSTCHAWQELKAAIDAADTNNSGCDSIP